jgi:hypothetical protein
VPSFLNLFVWYDALFRGWCVAYVGDVYWLPLYDDSVLPFDMRHERILTYFNIYLQNYLLTDRR